MKLVPKSVTRALGRKKLALNRNSPHIFFGAGLLGVGVGVVLACRATLKLEETVEVISQDVERAKIPTVNPDPTEKKLVMVYANGAWLLVKLYGPSALVLGASVAALTKSHVTLTRRNASLVSAYALVHTAFENYRERVKQELGEAREKELYHAVTTEVNPETKSLVKVANNSKWSPYARFFDVGNKNWAPDAEVNRNFIQCQQTWANDILQTQGYIFLNDVYKMLGLDPSKAGQSVGWVISPNGDNYVDFGIFAAANSKFVNGWEPTIILDFNVDGVIIGKVPDMQEY